MIDPEKVPKEPQQLLEGFEWVTMDLTDEKEVGHDFADMVEVWLMYPKLEEVWELLNGHYVEDDEAMFRFNYSVSFLNWYIQPSRSSTEDPLTAPGHSRHQDGGKNGTLAFVPANPGNSSPSSPACRLSSVYGRTRSSPPRSIFSAYTRNFARSDLPPSSSRKSLADATSLVSFKPSTQLASSSPSLSAHADTSTGAWIG